MEKLTLPEKDGDKTNYAILEEVYGKINEIVDVTNEIIDVISKSEEVPVKINIKKD